MNSRHEPFNEMWNKIRADCTLSIFMYENIMTKTESDLIRDDVSDFKLAELPIKERELLISVIKRFLNIRMGTFLHMNKQQLVKSVD